MQFAIPFYPLVKQNHPGHRCTCLEQNTEGSGPVFYLNSLTWQAGGPGFRTLPPPHLLRGGLNLHLLIIRTLLYAQARYYPGFLTELSLWEARKTASQMMCGLVRMMLFWQRAWGLAPQ